MFKTMKFFLMKNTIRVNKRNLWQWIDDTFNRVDDDRIMEIGPNMACAEWLMKNGAKIRWKGCKEFVNHYDCLPNITKGSFKQFQIEQVHAGHEASISHLGFNYFKNCKNISDIAFVGCHTITNEALSKLVILQESLMRLEINGCVNVSNSGILTLEQLQALKHLKLKNLPCIDETKIINHLKTKLAGCTIKFEEE